MSGLADARLMPARGSAGTAGRVLSACDDELSDADRVRAEGEDCMYK